VADIINFNQKDWTLFIGTAIFTFEGIGLIIPIQESMKNPKKFPPVLGGVMIIITVVFVSMGALSYAAYGSKTETVVILNLPQDDKLVNGVQFLYSLAILLSTPLQIFPAIRITENELFTRSGKYNPYIKWQKNVFRFFVVMLCASIAWFGYIYPVRPLPSPQSNQTNQVLANASLQRSRQDSIQKRCRCSPWHLWSHSHGIHYFLDGHELGERWRRTRITELL
jgi:amino acid permease